MPTENGFPEGAELEELNALEDIICTRLEARELALLVLTITTNNMREFVFYTRDGKEAKVIIDAIRSEGSSHELQSYVADDPKWSLYGEFA